MPDQLDYAVFAVLALAACTLLQARIGQGACLGPSRFVMGTLLLAILGAGWFFTEQAGQRARRQIEDMVCGYVETYAQELERMGHARLTLETPADDPLYLAMIEAEKRWLAVNPRIADIYTFRRRPGGAIVLLVDSETDYDRDGRFTGERELRTPIGEEYVEATPFLEAAFHGGGGFDAQIVTDRWGTWVSAVRPMRDAAGRIEGVLGVDFEAAQWIARMRAARLTAMGYLAVLIALAGVSGRVIGTLATSLQRARAAEAQLTTARDLAEAGSRAKSEFLANLSHEIRTPMNGVIGMTHILLETPLDAEQRDFAETIRQSSEALLSVLNDILDFSKIEAGQMPLENVDFDLRRVVESSVQLFAGQLQTRQLALSVEIARDVCPTLCGDPTRLRQVLTILLGNAVKFTERGGIALRVSDEPGADPMPRLRFEVEDSGIGIAAEVQPRLFQAFSQADGSKTRRYGGTGLGLAIARRIVEMMDGRIGLESTSGKGSRFWFTARFAPLTTLAMALETGLAGAGGGQKYSC